MNEMVERVARAIALQSGGSAAYSDEYWRFAIGDARAAIAALREPTAAMLDAGPPEPYMDRDVWARMIDAALAAGPMTEPSEPADSAVK